MNDGDMKHCTSTHTSTIQVVAAGVIWRNGCFVGTQRAWGSHAGQWEFPGGKVNPGESKINALARELREELGILVEKAEPWRVLTHNYGQRRIHLHVYHVISFAGEPTGREGQNMRWLTAYEATHLPFLEADAPLIRELAGDTSHLIDFHSAFGWDREMASGMSV